MKRSVFVVLLVILSLCLCAGASAAQIVAGGFCNAMGESVRLASDDEDCLTITGTGAMDEYIAGIVPRQQYAASIGTAVIDSGVTLPDHITFFRSHASGLDRNVTAKLGTDTALPAAESDFYGEIGSAMYRYAFDENDEAGDLIMKNGGNGKCEVGDSRMTTIEYRGTAAQWIDIDIEGVTSNSMCQQLHADD